MRANEASKWEKSEGPKDLGVLQKRYEEVIRSGPTTPSLVGLDNASESGIREMRKKEWDETATVFTSEAADLIKSLRERQGYFEIASQLR